MPAGFTISTDACNLYYANNSKLPANIETEMVAQLRAVARELVQDLRPDHRAARRRHRAACGDRARWSSP